MMDKLKTYKDVYMDKINPTPNSSQIRMIRVINDKMGYVEAIRVIRAFYTDEAGNMLGLKEAKDFLKSITS